VHEVFLFNKLRCIPLSALLERVMNWPYECAKEKPMIDHDTLEDFRDAERYDLQHEGY